MARQEFLSGGWVNKLGQTIGYNWHNKRCARSYAKPRQPNTPAQLAQQAIWKTALRLAHEAMNINGRDPAWDTTSCGEFALRTGTASRRLQRGMSEEEALPLYPDGYDPSRTLQYGAFIPVDLQSARIYIQGENIPATAVFEVALQWLSNRDGQTHENFIPATMPSSLNYIPFSFNFSEFWKPDGSQKVAAATTAESPVGTIELLPTPYMTPEFLFIASAASQGQITSLSGSPTGIDFIVDPPIYPDEAPSMGIIIILDANNRFFSTGQFTINNLQNNRVDWASANLRYPGTGSSVVFFMEWYSRFPSFNSYALGTGPVT